MSDWNSGKMWNKSVPEDGFYYNGDDNVYYINIQDDVRISDSVNQKSVVSLLDRYSMIDSISASVIFNFIDSFGMEEKSTYFSFIELLDKFYISDEFEKLFVNCYLSDDMKVVDELSSFISIITEENIDLSDVISIETLFDLMDSYGMEELISDLKQLFFISDSFNVTDRIPKTAISDFYIGAVGRYDAAYDWLIPFGMKVDYGNTNLQAAPEAEITSIEMPGIDGSIAEDTVYKDRIFQITAFSEMGMTREQKEQLKYKIASILDSTKKKSKKLTIGSADVTFDVKYDGQANISEGQSYVKVSIPFRAKPYGESMIENEIIGSGTITNDGDAPVGPIITIMATRKSIESPTFMLGEYYYMYYGTIDRGCSLIFDNEKMTCYYTDENGKKINALPKMMCGKDKTYLTKSCNFQKVDSNSTMILTDIPDDISDMYFTTWKDKILW